MKTIISKENLALAIGITSKCVSPRSTLPVLTTIYAKTDPNGMIFGSTNLEYSVQILVPAKNSDFGKNGTQHICIPLQISEMVSMMGNEVSIETNSKNSDIKFESGDEVVVETKKNSKVGKRTSNTNLKGIDGDEFPPIALVDNDMPGVTLTAKEWKDAISSVIYAVGTDDGRQTLTTMNVEVGPNMLRLTCTDSYRIASRTINTEDANAPTRNIMIPSPSIKKMMGCGVLENGGEKVKMIIGGTGVMFGGEAWKFYSVLVDGAFPNWRQAILTGETSKIEFKTDDFIRNLKIANVISKVDNNIVHFRMGEYEGEPCLDMISAQDETGCLITRCPIVSGTIVPTSVNLQFIQSAVSSFKRADTFTIEMSKSNPIVLSLKAAGDTSTISIVMKIKDAVRYAPGEMIRLEPTDILSQVEAAAEKAGVA